MDHGTVSEDSTMTTMNMAFTLAYKGTPILFSRWAPEDDGAFVGAWFAIFFLALLFRTLLWLRATFELVWASHWYRLSLYRTPTTGGDGKHPLAPRNGRPFRMQVEVPRMLLVFVTVVLGYALMLIAMTYVVGYFFAVCTGLAIGELILGRFVHDKSAKRPEAGDLASCCL